MKLWPFWYILIKWNLPYFSTFFVIFFFRKIRWPGIEKIHWTMRKWCKILRFQVDHFFVIFCPPPKLSYSPLRKSRTAVVLLKFFWAPLCFALLLTRVAFRRAQNEDNWPIISWLTSFFCKFYTKKSHFFHLAVNFRHRLLLCGITFNVLSM